MKLTKPIHLSDIVSKIGNCLKHPAICQSCNSRILFATRTI